METIKKDVARVIPKPRGKRGFVQGFFIPLNKEKYVGDLSKIFFRSSYEITLMKKDYSLCNLYCL